MFQIGIRYLSETYYSENELKKYENVYFMSNNTEVHYKVVEDLVKITDNSLLRVVQDFRNLCGRPLSSCGRLMVEFMRL